MSFVLAGAMALAVPIQANPQSISVIVNNAFVNFEGQGPAIVGDRTLVPVRGVFETLGFAVDWDEPTRQATLTRAGAVVQITIDSAAFTTNGQTHMLDVPAQIINDRTMLPLRAVLESVGYELDWIEATRTILVSTGEQQPILQFPTGPSNSINQNPPTTPATTTAPQRETPFRNTTSAINLPNRRLTDTEFNNWVAEYRANGGASHFEREVIRLTNIERAAHGLPAVQLDEGLSMAARFYAQTMANLNTALGHNLGPYGGSGGVADLFGAATGRRAFNGIAGQWTPESVVQAWMDSSGHRQNILTDGITHVGVGFHLGGQWGVFGYQMFANGASNAPNQANQVTLNITHTGARAQDVTVTEGGRHNRNARVNISATVNRNVNNIEFVEWELVSGNATFGNRNSASTNITLGTGNASIRAVFRTAANFTVDSTQFGHGTNEGRITFAGSGNRPTGNFRTGASAAIVAIPATGFRFVRWDNPNHATIDNINNASTTIRFNNPSNSSGATVNIHAVFEPIAPPNTTAPPTTAAPTTTTPPTAPPTTTVPPATAPPNTTAPTTTAPSTEPPITTPPPTEPPTTPPPTEPLTTTEPPIE